MNIGTPQRELGDVDVSRLREAILAQEQDAWLENNQRQQDYQVHNQTRSIVLLFCDESWPNGKIHRESGWDRLAEVAEPLMQQIIEDNYQPGGEILRAMAANLPPRGKIKPHRDVLESFHMGHRVHVPITTNPAVRFTIDGKPYAFEVGKAYEINNQLQHSVVNLGTEDRITFIFDYVPPDRLPSGALSA